MNLLELKVYKKILEIQVTFVEQSFTEWLLELGNLSASFQATLLSPESH